MRILAIETSCDETSASIVENGTKILSNAVTSSLPLHAKTGGMIPEIAARQQIKYIIPVIEKAISSTPGVDVQKIDAIAVTVGPGLIGSLLVGVETAKTLAYAWNKPVIPVNHLIGHIYANFIRENPKVYAKRYLLNVDIEFPALVLIVSGGHTDLLLMKDHGKLKWLGGTRDDAAGEAFDKIARLLNLPYPGGPAIEKAAINGNSKAFNFPRPLIDSNDLDFSFSGLKTAVMRSVILSKAKNLEPVLSKPKDPSVAPLSQDDIMDIAASVQQAIIDVLVKKTLNAAQKYKVKSILISGGVAANQKLRDEFQLYAKRYTLFSKLFFPEKKFCTDNAAMIASAAFFNNEPVSWQKITANPELYFK